jgi:hypothetical protein
VRALLLDDVAMNHRVVELILKHHGCAVIATEDVASALMLAELSQVPPGPAG